MITKKQFDVLDVIIGSKTTLTQREIAQKTAISVGSVNKLLKQLTDLGFVSNNVATEKGYEEMEQFRVKRAIIIAAGFGSRMVPITLNTPKPLVRVNGQRIIDFMLDALVEAEIEEIYVVRGYLAEQFDQLLYKYKNIKFIENPLYNEANNITSVLKAGELVSGSYILEADLLLYNKSLIKKYQYETNYLAIPVEKSDDWCFYCDNGIIRKMCIGGTDCHQVVGVSYWTKADGEKLAKDVKAVFEAPGGKERYWDQVPLEYFIDNYQVHIRQCSFEDILEIDTYAELKAIDNLYK